MVDAEVKKMEQLRALDKYPETFKNVRSAPFGRRLRKIDAEIAPQQLPSNALRAPTWQKEPHEACLASRGMCGQVRHPNAGTKHRSKEG